MNSLFNLGGLEKELLTTCLERITKKFFSRTLWLRSKILE